LFTARLHTVGTSPTGPGRPRGFRQAGSEQGFSLIELLVVCLVIGILCAIAVPSFLSQTGKAKDASAKELLHSAQVTAEAIATENDGSYEKVTTTELHADEPGVAVEKSERHAWVSGTTHSEREYSITATATDGVELTLARSSSGTIAHTCRSPVTKIGCSEGATGSW
jgi:type IV pilus assembly protein PilA